MIQNNSEDVERFKNRGNEDIYYDVLSAIDELQYKDSSNTRVLSSSINSERGRKASKQYNEIRGAMLRNVTDRCNLNSKLCKKYLMEMYAVGLVDLGMYMSNIDRDYKRPGASIKMLDRLITITEKGYKLLKLLKDMNEVLNFNIGKKGMISSYGAKRQRN